MNISKQNMSPFFLPYVSPGIGIEWSQYSMKSLFVQPMNTSIDWYNNGCSHTECGEAKTRTSKIGTNHFHYWSVYLRHESGTARFW